MKHYRNADTRSEAYQTLLLKDVAALAPAERWIAMIAEATRAAYPPDAATRIYNALGAKGEME